MAGTTRHLLAEEGLSDTVVGHQMTPHGRHMSKVSRVCHGTS